MIPTFNYTVTFSIPGQVVWGLFIPIWIIVFLLIIKIWIDIVLSESKK